MAPTSTSDPTPSGEPDPYMQVRLVASSREAFLKAVDSVPIDYGCAGPRLHEGGEVTASVLVRASALGQLRKRSKHIRVEVLGDFSANLAARRAEVGKGNRFADPRVLPQGLGVLMPERRR
jgi:hypothetical protein